MIDLFLCGIKQANDMDNVIRSASMKQRQRVTQKQCRHTHTLTHTNTYNTHARKHSLARSFSLALSKNESVKRGPEQSQFLWQMFTHFICTGVGAQRLCFTIILQPFQSNCFSFAQIIYNPFINSRTFTHTHTNSTHSRAPRKRRRKEWKSTRRWMTVDNKIHNGREYGERGKFAKTETGQRKRTVASIQNYHLG